MAGKSTKKVAKKTAATRAAKAAAKKKPAPSRPGGAARKIEQKIAELGDWRGETLARIRRLIHEVDPDVIEDWKWRGTPVWSHDGMYVLADAFKAKVKVTFHHGALLRDPGKLFNNGLEGKKWRAIDMDEEYRLDKAAFRALLREAIAYNKTHNVPKSRGSRE